jgi:hypothetical protein
VRGHQYGDGPNWRIRTLRRALEEVGLTGDLLRHGLKREVFLAPRGVGWRAFLRGETDIVRWFDYELADLADYWRTRWATRRAQTRPQFRQHRRDAMRLSSLVGLG